MRLSEIDQIFEETPGCRVVDELQTDESGVDPVGLRQLNLDLMDDALPGINNVTQHVRPYTFMAWAVWKATQIAAADGIDDGQVIADLVDRYEALYAWSHLIAGKPFRGAASLKRAIGARAAGEPFLFSGSAWDEYRKNGTSFMAPTEYGPSIKSIRYISADSGSVASEAMPAVLDFDRAVRGVLPGTVRSRASGSHGWRYRRIRRHAPDRPAVTGRNGSIQNAVLRNRRGSNGAGRQATQGVHRSCPRHPPA
ncbi:hypothetical protein QD460_10005 [Rhizobium jaguaris]|uniref:hypothetical protein n=1 Tax=Rhizobium jaguaris TaxID=1312183 RepID=UPI0039BFE4CA